MAQPLLHCPFCSKTSTRGTGLASHIRGTHPAQYLGWRKREGKGPAKSAAATPAKRGRKPGPKPGMKPGPKPGPKPAVASAAPGGLSGAIAHLEQQHAAILKALAALHEVAGSVAAAPGAAPVATKKRGMTPEGKKRLIAALKRRWAERKAAVK